MSVLRASVVVILSFGLASALYTKSSGVIELDKNNFAPRVEDSKGVWIVEFFAPWCGHCQKLAPEYKKAAHALAGIVNVAAVNCDDHQELCGKYKVKGFPTIKIFGANKKSPVDYSGARTAAGISDEAISVAKRLMKQRLGGKDSDDSGSSDGDVVQLTESNFKKLVLNSDDIWLVEFFAPWCGHCKQLAPQWAKAATELKGKVRLGAVDATVHTSLAQQYDVRGYPTIKYFAAGAKTPSSAQEYDGGRSSSDIVEWAMIKVQESLPAPKVEELLTNDDFESECAKKPLCIIAFLPHLLDCQSKCRNEFIDMLQKTAEKFKTNGWGWLWSEGGRPERTNLEESLYIGGFGYPALAVMNHSKMKCSVLTGSFSHDGIHSFLRDLTYNRGRTSPVKGAAIEKLATISAWDGKDAEMPVSDDDDIDLSDVDLDDHSEL